MALLLSALVGLSVLSAGDQPAGQFDIKNVEYKANPDVKPKVVGAPSGHFVVSGSFKNTSQEDVVFSGSHLKVVMLRHEGKKLVPVESVFYGPPDESTDAVKIAPGQTYEINFDFSERYHGIKTGNKYLVLVMGFGAVGGYEFVR